MAHPKDFAINELCSNSRSNPWGAVVDIDPGSTVEAMGRCYGTQPGDIHFIQNKGGLITSIPA